MKYHICFFLFFFIFTGTIFSQETTQKKEVFLVGIMKKPKFAKEPFRPILKWAKTYEPDAIYVQSVPAFDTTSLRNAYGNFLDKSDSILANSVFDMSHIGFLQRKKLSELKPYQHEKLSKYYYSNRNNANRMMHAYFAKNNKQMTERMNQDKNAALIFPLAMDRDIKYLFSIDDQTERKSYADCWKKCTAQSKIDKEDKKGKKILSQLKRGAFISGMLGRQAQFVNKKKTLNRLHTLESFRYRKTPCTPCSEGTAIWDRKNKKIADNIGTEVIKQSFQKSIVFVNASHLIGIKAFLEATYPEIQVKMVR